MTVRVLLADDHTLLRAAIRALLAATPDLEVVGEAADGQEAVTLAEELAPDVVVLDLDMPVMDGLTATRWITAQRPSTKVLVLTMHPEETYVLPVLEAGGSGFVVKEAAETELIDAIRTVARGEAFLYPSGVALLLRAYQQGDHPRVPQAQSLSDRETEVLRLTAEGFSNTEISRQIYLSPKTVDTYRQHIMHKLGLRHRAELVRYALRTGLLAPPSDRPAVSAEQTAPDPRSR